MGMSRWIPAGVMAVAIAAFGTAGASEGEASLPKVLEELSPVSLPDDAWAAYSLCLMEAIHHHAGKGVTMGLLIEYIETFDMHGHRMPGDIALIMDRDIIRPCMAYNPVAYIEERLHATSH